MRKNKNKLFGIAWAVLIIVVIVCGIIFFKGIKKEEGIKIDTITSPVLTVKNIGHKILNTDDVLELTISSDKELSKDPIMYINGNIVTYTKKENLYYIEYKILSTDSGILLKINNYTDTNGNEGNEYIFTEKDFNTIINSENKETETPVVESSNETDNSPGFDGNDFENETMPEITPPVFEENTSVVVQEKNETESDTSAPAIDKNASFDSLPSNRVISMYLNAINNSLSFSATSTSGNQITNNIDWSVDNTKVATISDGVVNAKDLGKAVVTAKHGSHSSTYGIIVKKKIIIVVGDNSVNKMNSSVNEYSSRKNKYTKSDKTLNFVGSNTNTVEYQTTTGISQAKEIIENYANQKEYIEFYLLLPIPVNEVKQYTCDELSSSNEKLKTYAKSYNSSIRLLIDEGYTVNAYIVSSTPVDTTASNKNIVSNTDNNACSKDYFSNKKVNNFNSTMNAISDDYHEYNFLSIFDKVVTVTDKNYTFSITYKTEDGLYFNDATANKYVKVMFDNVSGI